MSVNIPIMMLLLFMLGFIVDPPVVLKAKSLHLLEGVNSNSINVYVYHGGVKKLVPFQIDEKDKKGEYLTRYIESGDEGRYVLRKKGWRFGKFNGEDELVFMEKDCGEKAPEEELKRYVYEIEVKGEKTCYFYISAGSRWGKLKSYVRYEPEEDFFQSDYFAYGSIGVSNPAILNFFRVKGLPDTLIRRFRIDLLINTLWGRIKIHKTEEDVRIKIAGYTDGPVRLIKLMDYRMLIGKGIESPKTRRISISYRKCGEFPTQVNLPIKPSLIITNARLLLSFEFTYLINRFFIYIDEEKQMNVREIKGEHQIPSLDRLILKSNDLNILAFLDMEEELVRSTSRTLIIKRDKKDNFKISWKITGFENLKSGSYSFTFHLCSGQVEKIPSIINVRSIPE